MQVDAPKAANHNGYQQIIRPSRETQAGLKSLCPVSPAKAASSTECARGESRVRFPFSQEIPRSIPTFFPCDGIMGVMAQGAVTAIPAIVEPVDADHNPRQPSTHVEGPPRLRGGCRLSAERHLSRVGGAPRGVAYRMATSSPSCQRVPRLHDTTRTTSPSCHG
jgi:hypothetical protein